ncbi:uncharacterized protein TRIADDRAFT_6171, partial [Trichoplax adhaerens]
NLLSNIHRGLSQPYTDTQLIGGDYFYYHYGCDGVHDQGWGCGYRSLQTIASYIVHNKKSLVSSIIPTIRHIQQTLVDMNDKPSTFVDSKEWIGSFEICLCLEELYGIYSKIIHVNDGNDLEKNVAMIHDHFVQVGTPIMMGGNIDSAAKTIIGISADSKDVKNSKLLVVDPHFNGKAEIEILQREGWVSWRSIDSFVFESFYNFCLPQCKL